MRILLTNDDGFSSQGLRVLYRHLSPQHDVWIVAPDRNRSAVSHCLTVMTVPQQIQQVEPRRFQCSGSPVDCVICGIKAVLPVQPDIVISGINRGGNIGTDVLYSGTCAAARQAALYGIPGIAVSLESSDNNWNYDALADFIGKNTAVLASLCSRDIFLNINGMSAGSYHGWKITTLSYRSYLEDSVRLFQVPDGCTYTVFKGGRIQTVGNDDSDFAVIQNGMISISRVYTQPQCADDIHNIDAVKISL